LPIGSYEQNTDTIARQFSPWKLPVQRKEPKFPIKVHKNGVTVPVYRVRSSLGYVSYVIAYREGGSRKKRGYSTVAKALKAARAAATRIAGGYSRAVSLSGDEAVALIEASSLLKGFGVSLYTAVAEYVAAIKVLGKTATLLEAARHYARSAATVTVEKTVGDVAAELIATREKDGSSIRHVHDLDSRLKRFAAAVQLPIGEVTAAKIPDFLLGLNLAPRTVNNFRTSISNLVSFSKMRGFYPSDADPLK